MSNTKAPKAPVCSFLMNPRTVLVATETLADGLMGQQQEALYLIKSQVLRNADWLLEGQKGKK